MTAPVLGVDPGLTGAAVLSASVWWTWAPARRASLGGFAVSSHAGPAWLGTLAAVGYLIGSGVPSTCTIVLEGTYGAGKSAHVLAQNRGELLGGLRLGGALGPVESPLYSQWTSEVGMRGDRVLVEWARAIGLPRGLTQAQQLAWSEALAMRAWAHRETA